MTPRPREWLVIAVICFREIPPKITSSFFFFCPFCCLVKKKTFLLCPFSDMIFIMSLKGHDKKCNFSGRNEERFVSKVQSNTFRNMSAGNVFAGQTVNAETI